MKKNKFMKLASGLLVLCLMTTCVIGATLAKYTTGSNSQDSARVAKWGVRVSAATNPTFATEYAIAAADAAVGSLSVESSSDPKDNVVAPGTSGTASGFSVSGKPEVAVSVDFVVENVKDVVLKAGNYKYDGTDTTINVAADYLPVKFTLKQTKSGEAPTNLVTNDTLAAVETALEGLSKHYAPNTDLAKEIGTLELSWKWVFEGVNDVADTLLGDIAASNTSVVKADDDAAIEEGADKDYNLTVSYKVTITVTQID